MAVFSPLGTSCSRAPFPGPTAGISPGKPSARTGASLERLRYAQILQGLWSVEHSVKILNLRRWEVQRAIGADLPPEVSFPPSQLGHTPCPHCRGFRPQTVLRATTQDEGKLE